jgi:hypothetical protein
LCWADMDGLRVVTILTNDVLTSDEGYLLQLSGPAGRLAGVATHAVESGRLTAPTCIAAGA